MLRKYGMNDADYEAMLERQGGVCGICKMGERFMGRNGKPKKLAVDHNKNTGKVRGLLCHACNTGLGLFFHNPNTLDDAASYMRLTDG